MERYYGFDLGDAESAISRLGRKDAGEPDPMYDPFSGGLSRETRPPQLAGEDEDRAPVAGDQSDSWVYEELNPVDMTASELAEAEK